MVRTLLYLCNRNVRVARDSVNCVTINHESQDKHEKIMIASHVGLNLNDNTMVLRYVCVYVNYFTTLLLFLTGIPP